MFTLFIYDSGVEEF